MSLILYLFYTAELLKICNNFRERLSTSVFVNDTILLVYRFFTEWNCQILKHAHEVCLKWAYQYEIFFISKKYDLIHLSDKLSKFNMQITVQLKEITKSSDIEIRILEIWIDLQLKWRAHVKQILDKMKIQINALYRTTVSTWKVIFVRACQIYSVMIRSALIYEITVWHILSSIEKEMQQIRSSAVKLEKIQNKCLQTVTEVYRTTSVTVLKTEAYTLPLKVYLDSKIAGFRRHHRNSEMKKVITKTCRKIHQQLNIRQLQTVLTAEEKQIRWADQWFMSSEDTSKISLQQAVQHWWKKKWGHKSYQWDLVKMNTSCCKVLKTHKDLRKTENVILMQI